jgi:hypothetical protein
MLTTSEFSDQLHRLEKEFTRGEPYSKEKASIFYEEVKYLNIEHLRRVVDFLIGESRYTPNLSDLKKSIDATKMSSDSSKDRFGSKSDNKCLWCGNLGAVKVVNCIWKEEMYWPNGFHRGQPHQTNATCDCGCEAAKLRSKNFSDCENVSKLDKNIYVKINFDHTGIYSLNDHKLRDYY